MEEELFESFGKKEVISPSVRNPLPSSFSQRWNGTCG
jgi:hypothetical protein